MTQVIALAGVGNLGKYLFEQLTNDVRYEVIILSRKPSQWLIDRKADVQVTDYSEDSILSILDSKQCTAIVSSINAPGDLYGDLHAGILKACERSQTCKRLIPSEWIGDSEEYPMLPRFYGKTREPFRALLRKSSIQWTLFNGGWLMDYLLPSNQTYMPSIPDEFPVDPNGWKACIRGAGDEPQSFTLSRDIARAVAELLAAPEWDTVTYVAGEWNTFSGVVKIMEKHKDKKMDISYKSGEEITKLVNTYTEGEMSHEMEIALVEEWMISGAAACPKSKTLIHREKYFRNVKFSSIKDILVQAEIGGLI